MHFTNLLVLGLSVAVTAIPAGNRRLVANPTVTVSAGGSATTYLGASASNVDNFFNIPFAQAPVGNLRLKPPQPITSPLGAFDATKERVSCPQFLLQYDESSLPSTVVNTLLSSPFFQTATAQTEDCLTVNVQRPSGYDANAKLPVMVYIFGGGFELGWPSMYDGTKLISTSVRFGTPIVYVAINYRVAGWGFLAGKELQADGSTNLGLRDQRLALEWIQDNIAAFGGDPTKVTIWGESAGAISVMDHTVINGGDNSYKGGKLFRAAIMNSGSIAPADTVSGPKAQRVYDAVVESAGCQDKDDTLACLRGLSYTDFSNAVNSVPGLLSYSGLDLSYLPRPDPNDNFFSVSPEVSISNGAFAKVPIINGDQEDEGTLFSLFQPNITNTDDIVDYITDSFDDYNPDVRPVVEGLVDLYPNDFGWSGSPFNTGILNNIYPQFKRLAAINGDLTFQMARRNYLNAVVPQLPGAWSYLATYGYGTPVLGTFHGSDILYFQGVFGFDGIVPTMSIQRYYLNFATNLDPNVGTVSAPLINWPQYQQGGKNCMLEFQLLQNKIRSDDFRSNVSDYLHANAGAFRI